MNEQTDMNYLLTRIRIRTCQFGMRITGFSSKVMIHKSFSTIASPSHPQIIQKP
ncbi:hypothetical protein HanRHA438_Chr15g0728021 [Helianthus annuus]|nr:hypothetical protein HanRHA438_Chr15g0728021 [Helianthus annuus]